METLEPKKSFISWPVLALMSFVTVIGFDDLTYNFQNKVWELSLPGLLCYFYMSFHIHLWLDS